jgi:hypothetical protein
MVTLKVAHESAANVPTANFVDALTSMNSKVQRPGLYTRDLVEVKMHTEYWTS